MNLPFSYQKKLKIAMLLFCIMAFTLLIRILEDKSIKNMAVAFSSIYNDRLVPATDLFQLQTLINQKDHLFEIHFYKPNVPFDLSTLKKRDASIDSLLKKYEATFLTAQEKTGLTALKEKLLAHRQLEALLIGNNLPTFLTNRNDDQARFMRSKHEISQRLKALVDIQAKVGQELVKDSEVSLSRSKLYAAAQFVLAILIGVLIVSILFTANVVNIRNEKFNLN